MRKRKSSSEPEVAEPPGKPEVAKPEVAKPEVAEPEVRMTTSDDDTLRWTGGKKKDRRRAETRKSRSEMGPETAMVRLEEIMERATKMGVSTGDLRGSRAVKLLLGLGREKSVGGGSVGFWAVVLAAVLASQFLWSSDPQTELLKAWFTLRRTAMDVEKCISYVPDSLSYLFRPVEDCSICLNVSHVDKVSDISPSEFEQRYVGPGRPVVVVDGSRGWSAVQVFDFDFFRRVYRESDHNWESQAACQFFPYKTEFQQLRDVFNMDPARANMSEGTQPWYVGWSNCDERVSRILREHYEPPYFLPQTSENKQTDWIFMGSPGYGAKMHIDNVNYPSWQAQLKGTKTWTLQPPLECYYKCNTLVVDVYPGEIIVLDTNRWYHQTQITSKDLSITIGAEFD
nr:PREDICTED: F-box protein At5g06550-like isoform X4 [Bemisia tabaci]